MHLIDYCYYGIKYYFSKIHCNLISGVKDNGNSTDIL